MLEIPILKMFPVMLSCFGGGKTPSPPPIPDPTPQPSAADVTPEITAEQRRARIAALKYGAMATQRTGAGGLVGTGAELSRPVATAGAGKSTLGA